MAKNKKIEVIDEEVEQVKSELLSGRKKTGTTFKPEDMLSSGSTLLNLRCTGKINGCYPKGTMAHFVGDSDTGKSFLALTAFGEASINPNFDGYEFLYFSGEDGALMDLSACFGEKAAERIIFIPVTSPEEFYDKLDVKIATGKPFIAILDSMDSLMSEGESEKIDEDREARESGK
ncbi:MAG: hypothetical protein ACRDFB_10680, partial [Rhabdochlamydiaceae bacterium]